MDLTGVKKERKKISVWVESDKTREQIFYCVKCRGPVFSYFGDVVTIIAGNASEIMTAPFIVHCRNDKKVGDRFEACRLVYVFEGITT